MRLHIIVRTTQDSKEVTLNDGETLDICDADTEQIDIGLRWRHGVLMIKNDKLMEKEGHDND